MYTPTAKKNSEFQKYQLKKFEVLYLLPSPA